MTDRVSGSEQHDGRDASPDEARFAESSPSGVRRHPPPAGEASPELLEVSRFGATEPVEVVAGEVLTFPAGLLGMPQLRQFVLMDDPRIQPCRWLQSLQEPALAFVVVDPVLVVPEYHADIPPEDAAELELDAAPDAAIWSILTIHPDPARSTANLLAPVVINHATRRGKQVILNNHLYAIRHPLGGATPSPD